VIRRQYDETAIPLPALWRYRRWAWQAGQNRGGASTSWPCLGGVRTVRHLGKGPVNYRVHSNWRRGRPVETNGIAAVTSLQGVIAMLKEGASRRSAFMTGRLKIEGDTGAARRAAAEGNRQAAGFAPRRAIANSQWAPRNTGTESRWDIDERTPSRDHIRSYKRCRPPSEDAGNRAIIYRANQLFMKKSTASVELTPSLTVQSVGKSTVRPIIAHELGHVTR